MKRFKSKLFAWISLDKRGSVVSITSWSSKNWFCFTSCTNSLKLQPNLSMKASIGKKNSGFYARLTCIQMVWLYIYLYMDRCVLEICFYSHGGLYPQVTFNIGLTIFTIPFFFGFLLIRRLELMYWSYKLCITFTRIYYFKTT